MLMSDRVPPIYQIVAVKQQDLDEAIADFCLAMQPTKRGNIQPVQTPARQLYEWLIQPLKNELAPSEAKTIVYTPDGQLRYLPLAALCDGDRGLIERFKINNITAAILTELNAAAIAQPKVLVAAFTPGNYNINSGDRFLYLGCRLLPQK